MNRHDFRPFARVFLAGILLLPAVAVCAEPRGKAPSPQVMKLCQRIDLGLYAGAFVTLGDLDNDGQVDFLLTYVGSYNANRRIVALGHSGRRLWEFGDPRVTRHAHPSPTRGATTVFDIDADGKSEVIVDSWNDGRPLLCLLDGATGKVKKSIPSPLDMSARNPQGYKVPNRGTHQALIACLDGKDARPSIVLKYADAVVKVQWVGTDAHALWIPVDRMVVDGRGEVLGSLGELDEVVRATLHASHHKTALAVQAIAADVVGDQREELVLYQPYQGEAIFIFTQPDSDARRKPYVHRPGVYNRAAYF